MGGVNSDACCRIEGLHCSSQLGGIDMAGSHLELHCIFLLGRLVQSGSDRMHGDDDMTLDLDQMIVILINNNAADGSK